MFKSTSNSTEETEYLQTRFKLSQMKSSPSLKGFKSSDDLKTLAPLSNEEKKQKLMTKRNSARTLSQVLKDKKIKDAFAKYTIKEHSSENMLFFEYSLRYNKITDINRKFIALQKIYDKFLSKDATHPLNTRDENIKIIKKIIEEQEEIPEDVFDAILVDIKFMMQDTFSRFKDSNEFWICLEEDK
eukprot:gene3099-5269_t